MDSLIWIPTILLDFPNPDIDFPVFNFLENGYKGKMAQSKKCVYCSSRKGKRSCPALGGGICSLCCGEHRQGDIDCPPDCPHLGHQEYQLDRRNDQEIRAAMRAVSPPVLGYDILSSPEVNAQFAHRLETAFIDQRYEFLLKDADIIEALKAVYRCVYRKRSVASDHRFSRLLVSLVESEILPAFEKEICLDVQEKIVLRLILSVKNFTGGPAGEHTYLNYIEGAFGG